MADAKGKGPGFKLNNFNALIKETTFVEKPEQPRRTPIEEKPLLEGGKLIEVATRADWRQGEHKAVLTHLPAHIIERMKRVGAGSQDQMRAVLIEWALDRLEKEKISLFVRNGNSTR